MPFILNPYFWNRIARSFYKSSKLRERAHGDGVQVNPDSPEAFEEMIWLTFNKSHYLHDRIVPWKKDADIEELAEFFDSHVRKLSLIKDGRRYLSKNNGNIARLDLLPNLGKQPIILIPFRNPVAHVKSLHRQHLRFTELHSQSDFASEYMKAIGHFDFGKHFRPIDFNGWLDGRKYRDFSELNFWLEYWVAAFRQLCMVANANGLERHIYWLDFDKLCQSPRTELICLSKILEIDEPKLLESKSTTIRFPRTDFRDKSNLDLKLLGQAEELHNQLKSAANSSSQLCAQ